MVASFYHHVECFLAFFFWEFCTWVFDYFCENFSRYLEVFMVSKNGWNSFTDLDPYPYALLVPFHDFKDDVIF